MSPVMIPKLIVAAKVDALALGTVSLSIKLAQVILAPAANPNIPLKIHMTNKLGNKRVGNTEIIIKQQRISAHFLRPMWTNLLERRLPMISPEIPKDEIKVL